MVFPKIQICEDSGFRQLLFLKNQMSEEGYFLRLRFWSSRSQKIDMSEDRYFCKSWVLENQNSEDWYFWIFSEDWDFWRLIFMNKYISEDWDFWRLRFLKIDISKEWYFWRFNRTGIYTVKSRALTCLL